MEMEMHTCGNAPSVKDAACEAYFAGLGDNNTRTKIFQLKSALLMEEFIRVDKCECITWKGLRRQK